MLNNIDIVKAEMMGAFGVRFEKALLDALAKRKQWERIWKNLGGYVKHGNYC